MNTTNVVGGRRSVAQLLAQVRHASTKPKSVSPQIPKDRPDHGHNIYVFNHIQTNQIVYSLTKALKNNHALSQLPFNGKKTVPRALRKDLWTPMATVTFPPTDSTSAQGLLAFRKLREYRRLHETQWDEELREKAKNKAEWNVPYSGEEIKLMNKMEKKILLKKRKKAMGRLLCDQKANSVADLAVVLGKLDFNPPVEEKPTSEEATTEGGKEEITDPSEPQSVAKEGTVKEETPEVTDQSEPQSAPKEGVAKEEIPEVPEEIRVAPKDSPIVVHWKHILDAEYAESWPLGVVHDYLDPRDAPPVVHEPVVVPDAQPNEVEGEKEQKQTSV